MKIHLNKVTWYSKAAAAILFLITFAVAFSLGKQYGTHKTWIEVYRMGIFGSIHNGGQNTPGVKPTTPFPTRMVIEAGIGETAKALGISISPTEVLEDSRCPIDVQCIWAGTVKIKANIQSGMGTSAMIITPGSPVTTESEKITLTEVKPAPVSTREFQTSDYRFIFLIEKRTDMNP